MTLSPEQFNKLATKEDLKYFVTRDEMNEKFYKVLTAVDGVMNKLDDIEISASGKHRFVISNI
jgi:hypothetical protein